MEEASGKNLEDFFNQWLYKPGTLRIKGNWQYNEAKKEITIQLNQVQDDGSIFKMPLQVAIQLPGKTNTLVKTIMLTEKMNSYTLPVEAMPSAVILDPDTWVLMDAELVKQP